MLTLIIIIDELLQLQTCKYVENTSNLSEIYGCPRDVWSHKII